MITIPSILISNLMKMRNVDSRLTQHVPRSTAPPSMGDGPRRRALISRGAIKVCSPSRWKKKKRKKKIPSSAIHRLCLHEGAAPSNFFISFSGGSAREWNPPLARSCLRATICFYQRLPGDVNSHLPVTKPSFPPPFSFSQGPRTEEGARGPGLVSFGGRREGDPRLEKRLREKRLSLEGKMARVSHVALPMITLFPRDSHLLFTSSPDSFSLVSTLFPNLADITLPLSNWKRARVTW